MTKDEGKFDSQFLHRLISQINLTLYRPDQEIERDSRDSSSTYYYTLSLFYSNVSWQNQNTANCAFDSNVLICLKFQLKFQKLIYSNMFFDIKDNLQLFLVWGSFKQHYFKRIYREYSYFIRIASFRRISIFNDELLVFLSDSGTSLYSSFLSLA